jgi:5-methylcytosine-specific restriction endonuclease McrA
MCGPCRRVVRKAKQEVGAWPKKRPKQTQPKHDGKHLRAMPYAEFLRTVYWREVRKMKLRQAQGRCEHCCTREGLQVHHLHYKHRGSEHEHLDCLIVLCDACHFTRHNLDVQCVIE